MAWSRFPFPTFIFMTWVLCWLEISNPGGGRWLRLQGMFMSLIEKLIMELNDSLWVFNARKNLLRTILLNPPTRITIQHGELRCCEEQAGKHSTVRRSQGRWTLKLINYHHRTWMTMPCARLPRADGCSVQQSKGHKEREEERAT